MASVAAAVAVFYSLWSVALAVLFFARLRVQNDRLSTSVALVLPATGTLPGLEDLLASLTAQSLRPGRLIVSVESREDPVYPRVAALAECYPQLKIQLVVAGLDTTIPPGQVRNVTVTLPAQAVDIVRLGP